MSPRQTREWRHVDVTTFVSWFLFFLFVFPEVYVIGPLAGLGAPETIVALGALGWWLFATLHPRSGLHRGLQPLRVALFMLIGSVMVSFAAANRGMLPSDQARLTTRGLLLLMAMAGLALLISDGMDSIERLEVLLRRVVNGAVFVGLVGLWEYEVRIDIVGIVFNHFPILSPTSMVHFADFRAEIGASTRRISGTAIHPIEFAVVMGMVFPLAAHFALTDRVHRGWRRWWKVLVILCAQPLAQSRSGMIVVGLSSLILLPAWPRSARKKLYRWAIPGLLIGRVIFPGLLGTLRNQFLNYSSDPSYKMRVARYPKIFHLISQNKLFGRGFATFDHNIFFATDNQYLLSLIETGIIGTLVLIAVFVTAVTLAAQSRKWARTDEERLLGQALMASLTGVAVSFATWDVFSYIMATGLIFVLLGSAGALWRIQRERAHQDEHEADVSEYVRLVV